MTIEHDGDAAKLSLRKRLLFGCVMMALPFVLLVVLEGALRLFGQGGYAPLIREVGATDRGTLFITDPAGAATYFFANREHPGYNEQYSFFQPKPPDTVRIFFVGESAIKGFPEPRNLAASAFLRAMLQDSWPDKKVEIINLGITAVASYPVLEAATEALKYEPDLIVIHTGHNEFFGTYGVASVGRAGSRPWMLKANRALRSLALVQGLDRLPHKARPEESKTLMEMMIGRSYTAPEDWSRRAAARNLEANIGEMLDRCRARGVPALVCTLPTNERDLAPFGEDRLAGLREVEKSRFMELFNSATNQTTLDPGKAAQQLQAALKIFPDHARAHFLLGQALAALGQSKEAVEQFTRARDLDSLPWRAPSLSQEAIVRAVGQRRVAICNLEKLFRTNSPGGTIGWELMDDHVHPTLRGQWLMAKGIVESLTRFDGSLHVAREACDKLADAEAYARRLGDNPYDRYGVATQMRTVFNISFMRESNPGAFARFDQAVSEFENSQPKEIREALVEWQTHKPHAGGKRPLTAMVARVLMRQGKIAEAQQLYQIAQRSVPDYTSWHLEYVYFDLACAEKLHSALTAADKARALAEINQGKFLLAHGFSESGLTERYVGRLHQLRGEFAEAIPFLLASRPKLTGFDLVAADQALLVSYVKTGALEKARALAQAGADHSGQYAEIYRGFLKEISKANTTNR